MKLTTGCLFFLSVVIFFLVNSEVSTVTSSPKYTEEVPSTRMPHILSKSTEVSVVEGQNVTFQCSVDELGEFVITWLKNSDVYFAHTFNVKKDPRFTLQPDMSLHIENVHVDDAAKYICQISSTPVQELHHVLNVKGAPSVKTNPESGSLTVTLGERIEIGCDTSGDPPPVITWTHSMKEITDYAQGGTIFIEKAKKEHAGIYECKVDKGEDVPYLGKIEVNVHYAPSVETSTKLIYTGEGATAKISCEVFGDPLPRVMWLKDNERIVFSQDIQALSHTTAGHTHTLLIRGVKRSDLGIYTCHAKNKLGQAAEKIEVTGVPTPAEFKNGVSDKKSDSYAMTWSVKSHSPINEFRLKFRKRPINGEEYEWTEVHIPGEKHRGLVQTHTYDITGLEPASVYEAVILTRNKFGWNNKSEIFIFTTEGAVIEEETIDETVVDTSESHESMVKNKEATVSSMTETRTDTGGNKDKAVTLYWTTYTVTVLLIVTLFW